MVTALVWGNSRCFSEYIKQATSYRNSPKCYQWETDFINSMPTLHVIGPLKETGGLKRATSAVQQSALVTIDRIARSEIPLN